MISNLHGPWLVLLGAALLVPALRRCPRPGSGELRWLLSFLIAGGAARWAFGLWSVLHVNGQAPLWIRGALEPGLLEVSYGPGYFELLSWLTALARTPDQAVFGANVLLSTVSVGLLYGAARSAGVRRGGALLAAAVMAADPVAVRTAASELYIWPLIALTLATEMALALYARCWSLSRSAAWSALLGAGLLTAAAARIHPVGYLPLALSPLVVLTAAYPERRGERLRLAAYAGLGLATCTVLISGATVWQASRVSPVNAEIALAEVGGHHLLPLLGMWAVVWLAHWWSRPPWLALLAVASAALMPVVDSGFSNEPFQAIFYSRLCWAGILLGGSALVPAALQSTGWVLLGAAVMTLLLAQPAVPYLTRRTTEQREYDFLRAALRDQRDCTLASVARAGRRLWEIPSFLVPGTASQRAVAAAVDLESAPSSCLLYVHSSICSSSEARDLCTRVEAGATLERLTAATFAAVPSYAGLPYDRDEVEVVLYRVSGHRRGVSDGLALTPAFAQQLFQRLSGLQEGDGCRMTRLDTSRFRASVGLAPVAGEELTIEIAADPGGARWVVVASERAERDCGRTLTAIRSLLIEMGRPSAPAEVEINR